MGVEGVPVSDRVVVAFLRSQRRAISHIVGPLSAGTLSARPPNVPRARLHPRSG
jgi:hypothetical protein